MSTQFLSNINRLKFYNNFIGKLKEDINDIQKIIKITDIPKLDLPLIEPFRLLINNEIVEVVKIIDIIETKNYYEITVLVERGVEGTTPEFHYQTYTSNIRNVLTKESFNFSLEDIVFSKLLCRYKLKGTTQITEFDLFISEQMYRWLKLQVVDENTFRYETNMKILKINQIPIWNGQKVVISTGPEISQLNGYVTSIDVSNNKIIYTFSKYPETSKFYYIRYGSYNQEDQVYGQQIRGNFFIKTNFDNSNRWYTFTDFQLKQSQQLIQAPYYNLTYTGIPDIEFYYNSNLIPTLDVSKIFYIQNIKKFLALVTTDQENIKKPSQHNFLYEKNLINSIVYLFISDDLFYINNKKIVFDADELLVYTTKLTTLNKIMEHIGTFIVHKNNIEYFRVDVTDKFVRISNVNSVEINSPQNIFESVVNIKADKQKLISVVNNNNREQLVVSKNNNTLNTTINNTLKVSNSVTINNIIRLQYNEKTKEIEFVLLKIDS